MNQFKFGDNCIAGRHSTNKALTERLAAKTAGWSEKYWMVTEKDLSKCVAKDIFPNELVIAPESFKEEAGIAVEERYSFTAHSQQGLTVGSKEDLGDTGPKLWVKIDDMWDPTHPHTAIGRLRRISDLRIFVDSEEESGSSHITEHFKNNKLYLIKYGDLEYIGRTSQTLGKRFSNHKTDSSATGTGRVCTSKLVFDAAARDGKEPTITLIKNDPCKSLTQALENEDIVIKEAIREGRWLVNKSMSRG